MHPASLLKSPRGPEPARGSLLRRASGTEGVNNNKGEVGGAFLKVMWSVPGRGGEGRTRGGEGRLGRRGRGRSLQRVAVETGSSVGQCEVRGAVSGGDYT